ncbi:MAG: YadA-like family protein [Acidaminococcaceae bacterium]|nr:YadA-like family protein [Acidaminococcaceae bacterium]
MNRIYKVIWSKAKHCYVVASELAKRTSKGSGARSLTRAAITLGVVAGLTVGLSGSAWAEGSATVDDDTSIKIVGGNNIKVSDDGGDPHQITISATNTTYTAGNGIVITGDNNTIAAVAGTNVTVGTNGISVTGTTAVTSGGTNLITSGGVYTALYGGNTAFNGKSITTSGNATVGGNLGVAGATTLGKTLDVTGATTLQDTLTVEKDSTLKGKLGVTGATTLGDTLEVTGATTLKDALTVEKDSTLKGKLDVTGATTLGDTLEVTGATTLKDALTVEKDSTLKGKLDVTGATTLGDTLDVTGATTLKDTLTVDGKTTLNDALSVTKGGADITGNTIVRGGNFSVHAEGGDQPTFEVTASDGSVSAADGNFTVKGDGSIAVAKDKFTVDSSGNTSAAGTLEVTGATTLKDKLDVTGATTLGDTLTVEGNAELKSNLKVGGEALFNEGKTNQIKIDESGIRIGLHSGQVDDQGFYAGGHTWDEAKAAIGADGRVKGEAFMVNGKTYIDKDGLNANNQKIRNVAPGDISPTSTDATIGRQLYEVREELQADINRVGAGAAAMANLRPLDMGNKFSMAMGVGSYRSKTAMAMGLFYKPSDRVAFNVSGTMGNGHNMIGAGVSFALDKVVKPVGGAAAQAEIQNLKAENAEIKAELAELKAMIASMKAAK